MKIVVISDTHQKHRGLEIPPCDLLLHCGDFGSFGEREIENLEDADQWFAEAPAKQVVCTGGNHDFGLANGEFKFAHATLLVDREVEVNGVKIYGAPWCPELSGFAYFQDDDGLQEKWKMIPTDTDILVTHTPPQGVLDIPSSGLGHLGCPWLKAELKRVQPKYHCFGHIHASHGMHCEAGTAFLNASMVGGPDFDLRHQPIVIEF